MTEGAQGLASQVNPVRYHSRAAAAVPVRRLLLP
jgi:hypothetical protein